MGVPGSSDVRHFKSSFPSDHCQPSETSTRSIQNQTLASATAVPGGESRHKKTTRAPLIRTWRALRGYQIQRQGSRVLDPDPVDCISRYLRLWQCNLKKPVHCTLACPRFDSGVGNQNFGEYPYLTTYINYRARRYHSPITHNIPASPLAAISCTCPSINLNDLVGRHTKSEF